MSKFCSQVLHSLVTAVNLSNIRCNGLPFVAEKKPCVRREGIGNFRSDCEKKDHVKVRFSPMEIQYFYFNDPWDIRFTEMRPCSFEWTGI